MEYVIFGNNFDPDEFTALVNIMPTESIRKGDIVGKKIKRVAETNSWTLRIDTDVGNVKELFDNFFLKIKGKEEMFQKYGNEHEAAINVVIDFPKAIGPAFNISNKMLKEFSKMGISIDIDLYSIK